MLRYSFNMGKEADAIDMAVRIVLDDRSSGGLEMRTGDLGGKNTTAQVGDAVVATLAHVLGKDGPMETTSPGSIIPESAALEAHL
jgi:3-isopropylmalate dehydrogenase